MITALAAMQLVACTEDNGAKEESAGALAADSALAHDLALASADTAPFTEAADVAVAPATDSTFVTADSVPTSSPPSARVEATPTPVATGASAAGAGTPGARATDAAGSRTASSTSAPTTRGASAPAGSTTATTPPARTPARAPASAPASGTTAAGGSEGYVGPSCASPALADQRRCLLGYLARSDVALDKNYQALISRLKREAGTKPGAKEPASVERLRVAQRAWLVYRDNECRRRNQGKEGPLWAPLRAQCLAEYSEQRSRELASALAKRGG